MFQTKAQDFFDQLTQCLQRLAHVDYDETPESFLMTLPDGRIYLFNAYKPLEQLWMSSPISGGRHFIYKEGQWVDTRNTESIWEILTKELRQAYGYELLGSS